MLLYKNIDNKNNKISQSSEQFFMISYLFLYSYSASRNVIPIS